MTPTADTPGSEVPDDGAQQSVVRRWLQTAAAVEFPSVALRTEVRSRIVHLGDPA